MSAFLDEPLVRLRGSDTEKNLVPTNLKAIDCLFATLAGKPLVSLAAVPQGGLWTRMVDTIALWFRTK